MQSDFDKILNNRLRGYEADFSPADWQQMEKMLPEKSRKPFLLFALLLLLVGIGGLMVGTVEFQKGNKIAAVAQNSSAADFGRSVITESKSEKPNATERGKVPSVSETKNSNTKQQSQPAGLNKKTNREKNNQKENVRNLSSSGEGLAVIKKRMSADEKNNKVNSDAQQIFSGKEINNGAQEANPLQAHPDSVAGTSENATEFQRYTETVSALASIEAGFINLNDEKNGIATKKALSDNATSKHKSKKQIVSFAIGAGAGMNFSFTGAGSLIKPGYAAGIAQEIMFINRIGLSLTQSYTERKYDGGQYPCPPGTTDCPYSYTSTVRSVDFGADIKANLLHKTKWNWYAKAGIINTVKLKEEFSYNYTIIDTIAPNLPPQTNFNTGATNEAMDNLGSSRTDYPPDLTLSGAKRYHIAYHAATGVDLALKPNMRLQTEAGYAFTHAKAGVPGRHLHTICLNTRFLYLF